VDRTVVRDRDAHAWAECWIDDPSAGSPSMPRPPADAPTRYSVNKTSAWQRWWEWIQDIPGRVREWLGRLTPRSIVAFGAILVCAPTSIRAWAMAVLAAAAERGRRNRSGAAAYSCSSAELVRAGQRFERWLRRRAAACPAHVTWREHLRAIHAEEALRFVDAYDEARFGGAKSVAASSRVEALSRELF